MSHPPGPWSETSVGAALIRAGVGVYNGSPIRKDTIYAVGVNTTKNGNNNPKPWNKPSSYTLVKYEGVHESGVSATYKAGSVVGEVNNYPIDPLLSYSVPLVELTTAKAIAFKKLYKAAEPIFNGLIFAGEFRETKDMLGLLIDKMRGVHNKHTQRLSKTLKLYRKATPKEIAKSLADYWLTYQFGIAPLMSDMVNLNNAYEAKLFGRRDQAAESSSVISSVTSKKGIQSVGIPGIIVDSWSQQTHSITYKCGGTVLASTGLSKDTSAGVFGLRAADILPTVWELIPYSFLVDYFTNIGDMFAVAAQTEINYESGWELYLDDNVVTTIGIPRSTAPLTSTPGSGAKNSQRQFKFSRFPSSLHSYFPPLRFEHPNLIQCANIAALGASRLLKPEKLPLSGRKRKEVSEILSTLL